MSFKDLFGVAKETVSDWSEDKASRLAAALAYFTVFSLAPMLVIVIAIAGLVFGRQAAQNQIVTQVQGLMGQQGAQVIQSMIQNASKPSASIIATIIGLITLFLGASGLFGALQDSLNTIWEVAPSPRAGLLVMLRNRFVSFTMVLGVGFLLLVSLVLTAVLAALGKFIGGLFPGAQILGQVINFVISFGVVALLFALIYKVLPDVKIAWGDVWIGAVFTALLFTIGKFLIGLYLGRSSVSSAYGAAGSLAVLLVWTYYSAMILFLGAEFTKVYAYRYGSHIEPSAEAVPVTQEALAQQGTPTRERLEEAARRTGKAGQGSDSSQGQEQPAFTQSSGEVGPEVRQGQPAATQSGRGGSGGQANLPAAGAAFTAASNPRSRRGPGQRSVPALSLAGVMLTLVAFAVDRPRHNR